MSSEITTIINDVLSNNSHASDDIFSLGTDSLSSVRIATTIEKKLNRKIPLSLLYSAKTLTAEDIANFLVNNEDLSPEMLEG